MRAPMETVVKAFSFGEFSNSLEDLGMDEDLYN